MLRCNLDLSVRLREMTTDVQCRREHIVHGLDFRLISLDRLRDADIECSYENRWSCLTAGVEIKSNYTAACYDLNQIFDWRFDNEFGLNDRSCHWDSSPCPNEWWYTESFNYNPNATNSVITTLLSGRNMEESPDWPAQVFRTFRAREL